MKTYEECVEVIARVLSETCEVELDEVTPASDLQADLGLDSVGLLSLALELENEFEVYLGEDTENPPTTVHEIAVLLVARLEELRHAS